MEDEGMNDREVRLTSVIAGGLWALGVMVVVGGLVSRVYGVPAIGLLMAGAGGVMNIRSMVMRCEDRMQQAFTCGRDYQRGLNADIAEVHTLH
jgi:hypothetical protein